MSDDVGLSLDCASEWNEIQIHSPLSTESPKQWISYHQRIKSTIDWNIADGNQILIEQRDEDEIHYIRGLNSRGYIENFRVTPEHTKAANFAFDVTPRKYITGLITEFGILKANKTEIMQIYEHLKWEIYFQVLI